jgi:NTP pyrophosphatase (non-canonical NTP hydrolase)
LKDLQSQVEDIIAWQRKKFPNANSRSTLVHLACELGEAIVATEPSIYVGAVANNARQKLLRGALKESSFIETEVADLFILLVQLADVNGINLAEAVEAKMNINANREWQEPDSDGVIEHKE